VGSQAERSQESKLQTLRRARTGLSAKHRMRRLYLLASILLSPAGLLLALWMVAPSAKLSVLLGRVCLASGLATSVLGAPNSLIKHRRRVRLEALRIRLQLETMVKALARRPTSGKAVPLVVASSLQLMRTMLLRMVALLIVQEHKDALKTASVQVMCGSAWTRSILETQVRAALQGPGWGSFMTKTLAETASTRWTRGRLLPSRCRKVPTTRRRNRDP
jgi:hypothetical protein